VKAQVVINLFTQKNKKNMKSLRLFALLFILGFISIFVACNKEAASELPKENKADILVEKRGGSYCNFTYLSVWSSIQSSTKTPKSFTNDGMTWNLNGSVIEFSPVSDPSGRLGERLINDGQPKPTTGPSNLEKTYVPHHIIPTKKCQTHELVQTAAKAGFHMNEWYNGIWLPNYIDKYPFHSAADGYDTYIFDELSLYLTKIKKEKATQNLTEEQYNQLAYRCLRCGIIPAIKHVIEQVQADFTKSIGTNDFSASNRFSQAYNKWTTMAHGIANNY
jgi:A nuclease family of the HNH/ENDO VII superfamily with conserved AHH